MSPFAHHHTATPSGRCLYREASSKEPSLKSLKCDRKSTTANDLRRFDQAKTEAFALLLRKEVIQPQVPLRLPCYDFVPITSLTLGRRLF